MRLGLSPCVRGYQNADGHFNAGIGSIPVCTGLPRPTSSRSRRPWVYPRVYRATLNPKHEAISREGLSPYIRGYRGEPDPAHD
jgi:hypothetical protein